MRVNSVKYNTVAEQCGTANEQSTLTKIFFRQINSLVIYLVNALVSRNFCQKSMRVNFRNFHSVQCTQCGKVKNLVSPKNISSNQLFVISLLKTLLSRNICQKCVRLNRSNFHTVVWHSV